MRVDAHEERVEAPNRRRGRWVQTRPDSDNRTETVERLKHWSTLRVQDPGAEGEAWIVHWTLTRPSRLGPVSRKDQAPDRST